MLGAGKQEAFNVVSFRESQDRWGNRMTAYMYLFHLKFSFRPYLLLGFPLWIIVLSICSRVFIRRQHSIFLNNTDQFLKLPELKTDNTDKYKNFDLFFYSKKQNQSETEVILFSCLRKNTGFNLTCIIILLF